MDNHWAAEHLQVIRTLMERSALYRRALAPIMLVTGAIGVAAAMAGPLIHISTPALFAEYWGSIGFVGIIAAFLLARRQAMKDAEPFWSPPTRRVGQALLPPFVVGWFAGLLVCAANSTAAIMLLPPIWLVAYGCALHAAGFFMTRGIRLFGWVFVILGCAAAYCLQLGQFQSVRVCHYVMGLSFGALQIVYGVYLYFTENRKNAT